MLKDNNADVLLASAASKKKSEKLQLILILALVFLVLVVTVFLFSGSYGGDRKSANSADIAAANQPNSDILSTRSTAPLSSQDSELDDLAKAYTDRIKPSLEELPGKSIFGKRAQERIKVLERLFEQAKIDKLKTLEISDEISKSEDLIRSYQDEVKLALERLEETFKTFDTVAFERELSNLLSLAGNSQEVKAWSSDKAKVLEYFGYARSARRAKSELNLKVELDALKQIDRLGFGDSDVTNRINTLQNLVAEQTFAGHIRSTRELISGGMFRKANSEIQKAASIFPQRSQVKELTAQIKEELKKIAVADFIAIADKHGHQDDWRLARKNYAQAMAIIPSSKLAVDGYQLSQSILSFDVELNDIITRPLRLKSREVMEYARSLVSDSSVYVVYSPSLTLVRAKARDVLDQMSRPREVWIESDGIAKIRVQGVGHIKPTEGKLVSLIPGNYQFHAECKGRKAKLYNLTVPLSDKQLPIKVICGDVL